MKIKMSTLYAGPAGVMAAGSVQDVSDELGKSLVAGGYAQALEKVTNPEPPAAPIAPPVIETADVLPEVETAVIKSPRRKKG